jgi:GT2 family glycosyltransferase
MLNLKKYTMLLIKVLVKIMPGFVLDLLKKHPKLTALYSNGLHRSGLFYGRPSTSALAKLYKKNIQVQEFKILNIGSKIIDKEITLIVLIVINDSDSIQGLCESLQTINHSFSRIIFWCEDAQFKSVQSLVRSVGASIPKLDVVTDLKSSLSLTSCFLIHEWDRLHPATVAILKTHVSSKADITYVDRDYLDQNGLRHNPDFFPDWNPDLQLSTGYVSSGVLVANSEWLVGKNHLTLTAAGIGNWITVNYLLKRYQNIQHMPLVLLHSCKTGILDLTDVSSRFKKELESLAPIEVEMQVKGAVRHLKWKPKILPLVSLIIPTKNGLALVRACIESILSKTTYENYEIILVDNNSDESASLEYFAELAKHPQIKVLKYPHPFNYSAINNYAVDACQGEIIGLINNDIEVIEPEWLEYMVGHVLRDDIGCVGAKLLYPDDRIQHAGVVMGYGGGAGHAHKYFPAHHEGYLRRLSGTNNYSAVTAACLLVSKHDYLAVGGLDAEKLEVAFNDIDFCLKILELGRRNLYCSEAVLYHYESVSRGVDDTHEKRARFVRELLFLQERWSDFIALDPAYNPNLTLRRENFSISE